MSFIRVKKIGKKDGKKYSYAYLVENKWRKRKVKGSRQKVSKYLGAVISIEKTSNLDFFQILEIKDINEYLANMTKEKIVTDLARYELKARGFLENGKTLAKEDIIFDVSNLRFADGSGKENPIVIQMNEGFLCQHNLISLINFKKTDDEYQTGIELAKAFLEAGLSVPKEIFVGYFEKL